MIDENKTKAQLIEELIVLRQRVSEREVREVERKIAGDLQLHCEIVENMAEGVYLIRISDGIIAYTNPRFEQMFGYDPNEIVGQHVSIVNALGDRSPEEIAAEIIQSLNERGTWSGEMHNLKKDGTPFWCHAHVSTYDHPGFGPVWISVHEDITARKQAEEMLEEANTIINRSSTVAFTWKNGEGWPVEFVSDNVERLFGYTAKEFTSGEISYASCVHPNDLERVAREVERFSEEGRTELVHEPYRIVTKDGMEKIISDWAFLVRDEEGNITHYKGIVEDITANRQAEEALQKAHDELEKRVEKRTAELQEANARLQKKILERRQVGEELRESELWLREIFNALEEAVFVVTPDGKVVNINKAAQRMFGYSVEELSDLSTKVLHVDREHYLEFGRRIKNTFERGEAASFEFEAKRKNGEMFPTEHTVSLLKNEEGQAIGIASVVRDLSERRRIEGELKKLSSAVEQTVDAVVITDKSAAIEYANLAFEKITGYTKEEAMGQTPRILKSGKHSKDFYRKLWTTIIAGDVFQAEFINKRKNGELFSVEHSITPMKDAVGNITHFVAVWRDITERKREEEKRRQLERSLIQSERMASIGTAIAGIVHNIKGVLQHILIPGELLQLEYPHSPYPEDIMSSVEQMNQIIENILAKSRLKKEKESADINFLLERELDFLEADQVFKHEVEKNIRLAEELPSVECVATDFSQIFGNLLRNAVDAMYQQETQRLSVITSSDTEFITVEITDTGCGIPESSIPHLFEPFFTTKSLEEKENEPVGTGIGLFTVQQLLEPYGAKVKIESMVGVGTTFQVQIPV